MSKALLAIGEALVDFIPDRTGCDFDEVKSFSPSVGGAPANVCAAFAKLGGRARLITQLGNDLFGKKVEKELYGNGVDTSLVSFTDRANTALAFVSLAPDGNRTFSFYRNPCADMLFDASQVRAEWFEDAFALHFCSVSLGNFPMKKAHTAAVEYARKNGVIISFDPNLRFPLWKSRTELKNAVDEFLPFADILKISEEELEFICGESDIEQALKKLFRGNVEVVIYTCGKNGAWAFTRKAKAFSKAPQVSVADTTGAGDAFIGSFLWRLYDSGVQRQSLGLLDAEALQKHLDFSNAFCALSVTRYGAISSYPTIDEMKI